MKASGGCIALPLFSGLLKLLGACRPLVAFIALGAAFGQSLIITDFQIDPQGRMVLGFPGDTNSYYILRRGEQITAILSVKDVQLARAGAGQLKDPDVMAGSAFYRVQQVPLNQPLDTDGDGIDDGYELRHRTLLDPLNAADAQLDPDGDGKTTLQEYRTGTDPFAIRVPTLPTITYPTNATTASFVIFSGQAPTNTLIRVEGGAAYVTNLVDRAGAFEVTVPLNLNRLNRLFVSAVDELGIPSPPAPIDILQDSLPPYVFIDSPTNGAVVTTATVLVAGRVGDALSGFLGLSVHVNGQPAQVDIGIGPNGTFQRGDVPLSLGENTLEVVAMDRLGNSAPRRITVLRIDPVGPRLKVVSGDLQETNVVRRLARPIVVKATQKGGLPLANKVVNFKVTRSDGRLSAVDPSRIAAGTPGVDPMFLQLLTDATGEARVWWTLGSDAGHANNRITVTSKDVADTVLFCASAVAMPARQINIGSGNHQRGETLAPAPEPLKVWVSDGNNPSAGIPVTFRVVQGQGSLVPIMEADGASPAGPAQRASRPATSIPLPAAMFPGNPAASRGLMPVGGPALQSVVAPTGVGQLAGETEVTVLTGVTGHAEVDFTFGPSAGNHVIEAAFPGNPDAPAIFMLSALSRTLGQPTMFSGAIRDNTDQPVGGAYCELTVADSRRVVYSDAQGRFSFANIPSGAGHLLVQGGTATTLGTNPIPTNTFPALQYTLTLVPNAENTLPNPVLLPRLNPNNAVWYYGTNDQVLVCEGVQGLKMVIKAFSMKHPNGEIVSPQRPAWLSLNQVHHDDVPMPMPDGAAPPFAWTLQPGGATFEPPVRVEYPNMSGLAPGAAAFFLTFNHDTERFEIVASGHVVDDGSLIVTDPGAGLTISGWGCNCPPYSVTGSCQSDANGTRVRDKNGNVPPTQGQPPGDKDPDDPPNCTTSCKNKGVLNIGTVSFANVIVCPGQPITFTAPAVSDTGGSRQRVCKNPDGSTTTEEIPIPAVNVDYAWTLRRDGDTVAQGTGASATIVATLPGRYSCEFVASASRKCPPAPVNLPIMGALAVTVASVSTGTTTSSTATPGAPETVHVCLGMPGESLTLTAQSTVPGVWPQGEPHWQGALGNGATATFSIDRPSDSPNGNLVIVTCGNVSKAIRIVVTEVKLVGANGVFSFTSTPGPAQTVFVCLGEANDPLEIQADSNPDKAWPPTSPVWVGATGNGPTATFPISTPSTSRNGTLISATCGASTKGLRVVVLKVAFKADEFITCQSDRTFDAKAALTDNSFDKGSLDWSITPLEGPMATIDASGVVTFGAEGGRYKVTATSKDLATCKAETTVVAMKVTLAVENDLTECMQHRSLTYTATATGPSSGPVTFEFHYTHPDGSSYTSRDFSLDLVEDNPITTEDVPASNASHKYPAPAYVVVEKGNAKCRSETLNLDVYTLWIEHFRDNGTGKNWKVVVGESIAFKAFASSDCTDFEWDMEDGVPDAWNPTGGNAKQGAGMIIPYSDLARAKPDWFGEVYGTVTVRCKDGEGNAHTFHSTAMNPSMKAKVFFPPNLNVDGGAPSQAMPPCWYLFWKNGAVPGLEDFEYLHELGGTYGQSSVTDVLLGFGTVQTLQIGPPGSGTHYPGGLVIAGVNYGGAKGIDCCAEIVAHEKGHNSLALMLRAGAVDSDDDTLPDSLEATYACTIGNKDTYNLAVIKKAEYADYGDNEYAVVVLAKGKLGVPEKDWSKGGKQW